MLTFKCIECGNTFEKNNVKEGEIVACPICEADYRIQFKDGKASIESFIYEEEDLGEL